MWFSLPPLNGLLIGSTFLMTGLIILWSCIPYIKVKNHISNINEIIIDQDWNCIYRGFERFVNVLDNDGAIPLHMAARAGHTDIVNVLLNNGALVTAVTCKSTYGY